MNSRSASAEAIELASFPFCRPASPAGTHEERADVITRRGRRAVIDQTVGGDRGADPFVDDPLDLEDSIAPPSGGGHPVTDAHRGGRLRWRTVDPDVAT